MSGGVLLRNTSHNRSPLGRTPLPPLPLCRAYPIVGTVVHFSINYLCKKKERDMEQGGVLPHK